jgi:hypothetical protein
MHGRKTHEAVHFGEWKKLRLTTGRDAGRLQMAVTLLKRPRRCEKTAAGIQRDLEAHSCEFTGREIRRAAALDHVGEQRSASECLGDASKFFQAFRTLDEQHIRASFEKTLRPAQCCVDAFSVTGIGAGDDQEIAAGPRIDRDADLGDRVIGGNDPPAAA